ncbi:MAG: hypothetical protein HZA14_08105 [Nitrospirae bacterium]|nr:hypothetical protein [Nitrospirota bacterium]
MSSEGQKLIEGIFPGLQSGGYDITSPATQEYNCIAWAAGDSETWWWPNKDCFWPSDAPQEENLDVFIKVYEAVGYSLCDSDSYEEGVEKVAVYVDPEGLPTHAARQLSNGRWTSKLGKLEDIEHDTLEGISGHTYGSVAVIMKRPKQA